MTRRQSYASSLHSPETLKATLDHQKFTRVSSAPNALKTTKDTGALFYASLETSTWTCTKCNAQATPPVTTPLVLSATNITSVKHIITSTKQCRTTVRVTAHHIHNNIRPLLQPDHHRPLLQTTSRNPLPIIEQTPKHTT